MVDFYYIGEHEDKKIVYGPAGEIKMVIWTYSGKLVKKYFPRKERKEDA